VELDAYKCHVFLDFREIQDNEWHQYAHLAAYLNGRGVPSIEEALQEVILQPVHEAFQKLVNATFFSRIVGSAPVTGADAALSRTDGTAGDAITEQLLDEVKHKAGRLLQEIRHMTTGQGDWADLALRTCQKLEAVLGAFGARPASTSFPSQRTAQLDALLVPLLADDMTAWSILLGWLFTHGLGRVLGEEHWAERSRSWLDEWLLGRILRAALRDFSLDEGTASWVLSLIKPLITHQHWFTARPADTMRARHVLHLWLADEDVRQVMQVNRYRDVLWFNKEAFEQLITWMLAIAALEISNDPSRTADQVDDEIAACAELTRSLGQAATDSGYQVSKLLEAVS
jgi:hypothetical protein